jgi:hypothetical protein
MQTIQQLQKENNELRMLLKKATAQRYRVKVNPESIPSVLKGVCNSEGYLLTKSGKVAEMSRFAAQRQQFIWGGSVEKIQEGK